MYTLFIVRERDKMRKSATHLRQYITSCYKLQTRKSFYFHLFSITSTVLYTLLFNMSILANYATSLTLCKNFLIYLIILLLPLSL